MNHRCFNRAEALGAAWVAGAVFIWLDTSPWWLLGLGLPTLLFGMFTRRPARSSDTPQETT